MTKYLLWIITLFSIASYSQGKYILSRQNSKHIDTIAENKRIQIVTANDSIYWGRFSVVDRDTIMIEGNKFPMSSIVKIKRKSLFEEIVNPTIKIAATTISYPKGKYIMMSKKNSKRVDIIAENKRIQIKTVYDSIYWGRFTVVDRDTIMIEGNKVPLNSIVKIKRKSAVGAIVGPIFVATGSFLVYVGVIAATAGGYGPALAVLITPPGVAMVLGPLISNNHPIKRWEYSIKSNDENSPDPSTARLGEPKTEP